VSDFKLNPELVKAGFQLVKPTEHRRFIISSAARDKCGKTHFACTLPDPICYFNLDFGDEGVLDKLVRPPFLKRIARVNIQIPATKSTKERVSNEHQQKYVRLWETFNEQFLMACDSGSFRTVVVDTHDEAWALLRLARFGKLEQIMPEQYGPVNAEFSELSYYPRTKPGLNAVYIHKMGKQYTADKKDSTGKRVRGEWNGEWEAKGFNTMSYIATLNIEHGRYLKSDGTKGFCVKIVNSRDNPELDGTTFTDGEPLPNPKGPVIDISCTFPFIASQVMEGTAEEDWQ
jgi:hypothetical protein